MTNYEYMKNITIEKLSHFLCGLMDDAEDPCKVCPMRAKCKAEYMGGGNGWLHWLKEEKK